MEGSIRLTKSEERKIVEKNRRNQMKFLYSQLFSLIPQSFINKGGDQVSEQTDRAIEYIKTLKTNLELSKNTKEKLLSRKRSHEQTNINVCKPIDVQIHEMSHDLDAVFVTGLLNHSSFCKVVQLLDQYSTEVALANFSSYGHLTCHIRHKKIEAEDICKRIKVLLEGSRNTKELSDNATFCNQVDSNLSVWPDFDFHSNIWDWELDMMPMNLNTS